MERHELKQRLEQWQQAEADTLAYLEYVRAQIHRVQVDIGALTVLEMRQNAVQGVHNE